MLDDAVKSYEPFLERHAADLSRIARASRGGWKVDDVRNEVWLLAFDIGQARGRPLDLDDADDASLLIRYLYNHCVKYAETVVRYAQQMDHAAAGDDEHAHHWLKDRLIADDGADPLSLLEAMECAVPELEAPDAYHSVAASWLWLLHRFDQRMADVASFLLISVSWCYACCREAEHQARTQRPLPHNLRIEAGEDAIQPWRRFKLPAVMAVDVSAQLALDFCSRPAQPHSGQLWLL